MTITNRSSARRVLMWSLGVGCASALVAIKEATTFGASDWQNIAVFFAGGCVLGCLLGLLTTAYNQKRKSAYLRKFLRRSQDIPKHPTRPT